LQDAMKRLACIAPEELMGKVFQSSKQLKKFTDIRVLVKELEAASQFKISTRLATLAVQDSEIIKLMVEHVSKSKIEHQFFPIIVIALGKLGEIESVKDEGITSALYVNSRREDSAVRGLAMWAPRVKKVEEYLRSCLELGSLESQSWASIGLANFGIEEPKVVAALLKSFQCTSHSFRKHGRKRALAALGNLKVKDEKLLETFVKQLQGSYTMKKEAAIALGVIGVPREDVTNALVHSMKDKDPIVRRECVKAVGKLGLQDTIVTQALMGALKDEEELVRVEAARAIHTLTQEKKV